ncbi:MAG: diadenylate cyclase [Alistipes sp.]
MFFKNSPLHDGAMVIADDRIAAARCVLPSTEREVLWSSGCVTARRSALPR